MHHSKYDIKFHITELFFKSNFILFKKSYVYFGKFSSLLKARKGLFQLWMRISKANQYLLYIYPGSFHVYNVQLKPLGNCWVFIFKGCCSIFLKTDWSCRKTQKCTKFMIIVFKIQINVLNDFLYVCFAHCTFFWRCLPGINS